MIFPKVYNFYIPEELPSLNKWQNMHWGERDRMKKRFEKWIFAELWRIREVNVYVDVNTFWEPKFKKAKVIVHTYRWSLVKDEDNKIVKGLLDALVNEGVIIDDSTEVIESMEYNQSVDRKHRRTLIQVTEIA